MELLHELSLTAFIAALLSSIIAKLVTVVSDAHDASASTSTQKDSKFSDNGLKFEGFESEETVNAFTSSVVEKVNQFQHVSAVDFVVPGTEKLDDKEILVVGSPEKSSEVSSGEVTNGVDCEEIISVGRDSCCTEERQFSGNIEEQSFGVERDMQDGEFNAKNDELKEDYSSDDDGWEGIEITETEKIFAGAVKFVTSRENIERLSSVGSDVLMELDALHKVVAEGPCLETQPMVLRVSARAKWNARQSLGNMSPDKAMEHYVALLSQNVPGWMDGTSENIKLRLAEVAIPSTSHSNHQTHSTDERQLEPVSTVKEGDLVEDKDVNWEMK